MTPTPANVPLFLYEDIMLLALRDEQGTIATQYVGQVIAGAVMAELLLSGCVVVDGTKKQMLDAKSTSRSGDPIIDEMLADIASAQRRRSLKSWVERIAGTKKLSERVAQQLVTRGIVRVEESKVLFIFTRDVYPQVNPVPEKKIIERLRGAVFGESAVSPRTAVLVALADGAGLLSQAFGRREVKLRKKRIAAIVSGSVAGKATKEIIAAQQAAVMAAAILPAIVISAVHH